MDTRDSQPVTRLAAQWQAYRCDAVFRALGTMETLGEHVANMERHEATGVPPLLHCEAEPVADGLELLSPCSYRLLRITRCGADHWERPRARRHGAGDRGGSARPGMDRNRPLPSRLGVGMALREGHPVYFMVFDPQPVEGQTLGAVIDAIAASRCPSG